MRIMCHICKKEVDAVKVTGRRIYPHRPGLFQLSFWQCPDCDGYVGSHKDSGKPLGDIVSKDVKNIRIQVHNILDPIWKTGKFKRKEIYKILSRELGWNYHTAKIRTVEEGRQVLELLSRIKHGGVS